MRSPIPGIVVPNPGDPLWMRPGSAHRACTIRPDTDRKQTRESNVTAVFTLLRKINQGRERGNAGMRWGEGWMGGGLSFNHLVREGLIEGRPRLRVGRDGWLWGRATGSSLFHRRRFRGSGRSSDLPTATQLFTITRQLCGRCFKDIF